MDNGKVWQRVVEYGTACGMQIGEEPFCSMKTLKLPDSDIYFEFSVVLDPGRILYVEQSFYDSIDLSWVDKLDYVQISISKNAIGLSVRLDRTSEQTFITSGVCVDSNGPLTCAWCLEESQRPHIISLKASCDTFLCRKQALRDSRAMWLRWCQVARLWLSEDVTKYGGWLLVIMARG